MMLSHQYYLVVLSRSLLKYPLMVIVHRCLKEPGPMVVSGVVRYDGASPYLSGVLSTHVCPWPWKHNYLFIVVQMLVGVGDLINYTKCCKFQDLVGVGDLKMTPVYKDNIGHIAIRDRV